MVSGQNKGTLPWTIKNYCTSNFHEWTISNNNVILISLSVSFDLSAPTSTGLRLTEVRIPNHVVRDSTARLECHYDLDGDALYSVKWYRDGLEFYRYVPRDMPPAFIYDQSGLSIDVSAAAKQPSLLDTYRGYFIK